MTNSNLTIAQILKVNQAIAETKNLLNKELSYSCDLQKKDKVDFYQTHIVKLQNMVSDAK